MSYTGTDGDLHAALRAHLPVRRVVTDPLRRLAYGTDASFYRLVPRAVVIVDDEDELRAVLRACAALGATVTFRAAGTSLSGQAISDSVLVLIGEGFRTIEVRDGGASVRLGPSVIGGHANRALAALGRKIGPDPASIDTAKIGGIAANNASGMCCGTRENSYHTLAGLRVVLADGAVLDTDDAANVDAFRRSHASLLQGVADLARRARDDAALAARIRHKYRMKNTTGYGLNALLDFDDPVQILAHLMIGSEGTLGFISAVTYRTVPDHANKAAALMLFDDLRTACEAVTAMKATPVAAVELMDRPALASVESKPGLPDGIAALGPGAAALLVETRAETDGGVARNIEAILAALSSLPTATPIRFTRDAHEIAGLWKVRKGTFPSVGAVRATGTTVIIEDVAFPVERLADATLDLQALLHEHGYREAIIFGHALEGNLHFVFTQDFGSAAEVQRYGRFMDAVARLVVQRYDGALKAEHGTGRNMAPFVELEWGAGGAALMRDIKRLFDPAGLLNPGVIISDDRESHLHHLKPLPAAHAIVDKCIECGFCEPMCPSAGLTLSPRQRITSWREIARRDAAGEPDGDLRSLYGYAGIDTCAACGLCATVCPVGIETGKLIKALRGDQVGRLGTKVGAQVGSHFAATTRAVRTGLAVADAVHGALGTPMMARLTHGARALSGNRVPQWTPAMPRASRWSPQAAPASTSGADRVVYFPSCAARTMGPARGDAVDDLPTVTERVLRRAGYDVVHPPQLEQQCCGQPFDSKGHADAAVAKADELEAALRAASEGGRWPIVFDTSPCAYRMKQALQERLPVFDLTEFLHDHVLPRLALTPTSAPVAVHPVCSIRKMGLESKVEAVARACCTNVTVPPDVTCCGWAGDRGFSFPELNAHALRTLPRSLPAGCTAGYSSSRTCEIGLSEHGGVPYRSIVYLVDECSAGQSA
ncbi:MAG: FAD-binding oxidoreductase [Burkholderiaceae bacterium]|nr:FAD-binding oxidoreductase [Burkholderiaceae bacterium]